MLDYQRVGQFPRFGETDGYHQEQVVIIRNRWLSSETDGDDQEQMVSGLAFNYR